MRLLTGTVTALVLVVMSATTAQAASSVTTLPTAITTVTSETIPFTIAADTEICEVSGWNGAEVKQSQAGYELVLSANQLRTGSSEVTVAIDYCDGDQEWIDIPVSVPFLVSASPVVSPDSELSSERQLRIDVETGSESPVDVAVLRNGDVIKRFPARTGFIELEIPISRKNAKGSWEVVATGAGLTTRIPVEVGRGWAPLISNSLVAYPACSTVTWKYESKGQPRGAATIKKDIRKALRLAQKATGLRFEEVPASAPAQLVFDWAKLGTRGTDGVGGMSYSTGDNSSVTSSVTLNSQSDWVTRPGFGRSSYGSPNRGALILHELGHALGLGHVTTDADLMYPVSKPGSPTRFSAGDRRGLDYLYQPSTCSN